MKQWLWFDREMGRNEENYIGMFDLTKGLLMFLIILIHAVYRIGGPYSYIMKQEVWIRLLFSPMSVIQYGCIPMLFMICGYGIRSQSIKKSIKKNLKMFLIPYLGVTSVVIFGTILKWMIVGGSLLGRLWYHVMPFLIGLRSDYTYIGNLMGSIGSMWFPLTYILSCIYLNMILKIKRGWIQIILLITGSMFALCLGDFPYPFCIQQILISSGFLFVGMYLKRKKIPQKKFLLYMMIPVYLLCVVSCALGGYAEVSSNRYYNGVIDLVVSYIAGVTLLSLCLRLNALRGTIPDMIRWIGRRMFWFCCIHTTSYVLVPWDDVTAFLGGAPWISVAFEVVFSFIYALIGCILLEMVIKKIVKNNVIQ